MVGLKKSFLNSKAKKQNLLNKSSLLTTDFTHWESWQKEHFAEAEVLRFRWQTENPFIRQQEISLLTTLTELLKDNTTVLEVGAGEGANLVNLAANGHRCFTVAIDFSFKRSELCQQNARATQSGLSHATLCADATRLPFADKTFDVVYCRDLLHHIAPHQKQQVVLEMFRVCKPGGKIVLFESNGRNPIIFLHSLLVKAERGQLKSSPALFKRLVEQANGKSIVLTAKEPLPLFRLLLHYRFGLQKLGTKETAVGTLVFLDKIFSKLIPEKFWAYSVVISEVPSDD